jgi:hypothetical protein
VKNGASTQDQHVHAAKLPANRLRQFVDVFIAGEVSAADVAPPTNGTDLLRNRFESFAPACHQANLGALRGKSQRNAFADATAGSGDNCELIFQGVHDP